MSTDLIRFLTNEDLRTAGVHDEHGKPTTAAMGKTVEQRAATSVWCASSGHEGLGWRLLRRCRYRSRGVRRRARKVRSEALGVRPNIGRTAMAGE
jgi:hypothetical protein